MQIPYDKSNLKLNYFNNYVKFYCLNNDIYFYNTLYYTDMRLKGTEKINQKLIKNLYNGINTNDLLFLLGKYSPNVEKLFLQLLKKFIIE